MTLDVVLRPEAQDEIREAFEWYETSVPGLGDRFLAELDNVFLLVAKNAALFPSAFGFRRAVVRRFPYCVYFRESDGKAIVVAVFHGRRNPTRLPRP